MAISLNSRHWATNQHCVYCNSSHATERDHVPPKGFFTKPLPSDIVVVPVCTGCNQQFSKSLDEPARAFLLPRLAYRSASATSLWKSSVLRGLSRNRRIASNLRGSFTRVRTWSPNGLFLGHSDAVLFPKFLFNAFIDRLVRGLHWHCYGEPVLDSVRVQPFWVNGHEFTDPEVKTWIHSGRLHSHGGGQFQFKVFDGRPNDKRSFWVFQIHDQMFGAAICHWA